MTLSQFAELLSNDPKKLDALIASIQRAGQKLGKPWSEFGAINAEEKGALVRAIQSSDKSFLNSFPVMTVPQMQDFLKLYGRQKKPASATQFPAQKTLLLTGRPQAAGDGEFLENWGNDIYHGDKTRHDQSSAYGDNQALAQALNLLSLNRPGKPPKHTLVFDSLNFTSVEDFLTYLLANGNAINASDKRFFANFGGLWYDNQGQWASIVTPLFADTGVVLPSGQKLIVPVSHAELEISIHGPRINTDLIYYFSDEGSAEFIPKAAENKPWVGDRVVNSWTGMEAVKIINRAATTRRELIRKANKYHLPMGGYGPLGACTDIEAMITGNPIYPEIRNPKYYSGDMTMDAWAANLPLDGKNPPSLERVWDSLPISNLSDLKVPQSLPILAELKRILGK